MEHITWDLIFSFWIDIWFVLYFFGSNFNHPVSRFAKREMSPLFAFYLATAFNLLQLGGIIHKGVKTITIVQYIIMLVGMKLIPIAIMNYKHYPVNPVHDLFVLLVVFGIYNLYLYSRGTHMYEIYSKIEKSMVKGENRTPVFILLEKIRSYF